MKKYILGLLLLFIVATAFSLEVARSELEVAGESSIIFDNYTGPHDIINTIDEIKAIGSGLAGSISTDKETMQNVGDASKYTIIHAVDPTTKEGLDADILMFGKDSLIDHIDNVRRIIEAYLVAAYDYSEDDAETIAYFVTIYNAVYRGDVEYFSQKYKSVVADNLTASAAGLSQNYKEWAGNSQIVIPLSSLDGGLGSIDSTEISNDDVVEEVKKDPDKGIDERKELVEIKEEEVEKSTEKAKEAQKEATESKKELAKEEETLKEVQKEAEEAEKVAKENPDDKEAQKEAEVAKEKVEEQEKVVEEKKEEVVEKQEEAKVEQDAADKKREDAQSDRVDIAEDQEEIIEEQLKDEKIDVTYGLKLVNDADLLSTLVLIDTATGEVVKESSVNVIRNRVVYQEGEEYVAIAGTTGANAAVRLVKLDNIAMEITKQSEEKLAIDSVLAYENGSYYAVIEDKADYFVGQWNSDLKLIMKSPVPVMPKTPITVTDKGILVNNEVGKPTLLDNGTLEAVSK